LSIVTGSKFQKNSTTSHQRIKKFITQHKSTLRSDISNSKKLEYAKRFGKASYLLEVEYFMGFAFVDKLSRFL